MSAHVYAVCINGMRLCIRWPMGSQCALHTCLVPRCLTSAENKFMSAQITCMLLAASLYLSSVPSRVNEYISHWDDIIYHLG